jgi:hypothetical protein
MEIWTAWLYFVGCCLKIDNARPFVNPDFTPECRHERRSEGSKKALSMKFVYTGHVEVLMLRLSSMSVKVKE